MKDNKHKKHYEKLHYEIESNKVIEEMQCLQLTITVENVHLECQYRC